MSITYTYAELTSVNGTDQTIYTVPADTVAIIAAVIVGNSDSSEQTITNIKLAGTEYLTGKAIPSDGQLLSELEGQFLAAGETVQITATGSFINIRLSIKERSLS